ncbi:MAG TPA: site-specific integrase [Ktedonobacteraceae bacterium]|nr:site-specific integrase [Ktedonobacteraceae bacterium]
MVKAVWARTGHQKQLYLVDESCEFIPSVKRYLDYLAALEKSPHTLENYCRHLCCYFTFLAQAHLDWQQVSPDDLVRFVQWLRNPFRQIKTVALHGASPLSERSVNTIVTAVSSFYRYQVQRGETLTNPVLFEQISNRFSGFKPFLLHTSRGKTTRRVVTLKVPEKRVQTITDADFAIFLALIDNFQFRCIVLLMREGGLRMGEVLGLFIQDLEFHRNGIWIRRRSSLENGALAKNLQPGEERFIDLSPELMVLLDHLLLQHTFDTDHLFVVLKQNAKDKWGQVTYGRPLACEAVKGLFRHYSQKSGIPVHAHLLRHSHATELIKAGWDASFVQKRLGHAQVQTTINTYVHLNDDDLSQKWRAYQQEKQHESSSSRENDQPS